MLLLKGILSKQNTLVSEKQIYQERPQKPTTQRSKILRCFLRLIGRTSEMKKNLRVSSNVLLSFLGFYVRYRD